MGMVAEKNTKAPKHPELEVPNLQVIKALTSLKSRGYVKEQFAWRHFYWYLTNEGTSYLREYLHLPNEIVPATLKRQAPRESRPTRSAAPRREMKEGEGDLLPTDVPPVRQTRPPKLDPEPLPWSSAADTDVADPPSNL